MYVFYYFILFDHVLKLNMLISLFSIKLQNICSQTYIWELTYLKISKVKNSFALLYFTTMTYTMTNSCFEFY